MSITAEIVDVFGARPFSGNPLAVLRGADALSTAEMQRIARWFNLSETAFLLSPSSSEADYRVRIFTLDREIPFAGHPTLGSCHVWLGQAGGARAAAPIVQECGAGLVRLRRHAAGLLSFAAPPLIRSGAPTTSELEEACEILRVVPGEVVDAAWIDNGPGWLGVELASADRVLALEPRRSSDRRVEIGVIGAYPPGSATAIEVRAFFSDHMCNIVEDPVTGSLNASVGQWLLEKRSLTSPYIARQGSRLGREGRIHVERDTSGQVWVGGTTRTHLGGELWPDQQPL